MEYATAAAEVDDGRSWKVRMLDDVYLTIPTSQIRRLAEWVDGPWASNVGRSTALASASRARSAATHAAAMAAQALRAGISSSQTALIIAAASTASMAAAAATAASSAAVPEAANTAARAQQAHELLEAAQQVQEAIVEVGMSAGGSLAPAALQMSDEEASALVAQAASSAAEAAREASAATSAALAVDAVDSLPVTTSTASQAEAAARQVVTAAEALEGGAPDAPSAAANAVEVAAEALTDVRAAGRALAYSFSCDASSGSGGASTSTAHTLDATQAAALVLRTAVEPSDIANVVANERNSSSVDAHKQAVSQPAQVELPRIRVEALVLTNALAEADALVAQRRCPIVDALLNAIGGDEHDRAAAMRLLGRVSPSELAPHAGALVLHVGADDTNVSCAALHVLSRLLPSALTESDHVALLRVLRRASATVQRVAVLAPAPLPVECLRLLRPAPPLCEPPLLVVHADRAIDGELDDLADGALVVALVVAIGPDALRLALLDKLPLRARRALACASVAFRGVVTPHLRASMLAVADEDADWDNAAFVARLPDLTMLCMGVGAPHDLQALRAQPQLNLAQLSVESALFLGAVLGGSVESVRLSLPDGFGAPQVVHAAPMRQGLRLAFGTPRMGAADVAFFRGVFARNPHFKPDDVEAALRGMVEARGRRRSYVTATDRALLQAGVDAFLPTVNVALAP